MPTIRSLEFNKYTLPLCEPIQVGAIVLKQRQGVYLKITSVQGWLAQAEVAPLPGLHKESLPEAIQQINELSSLVVGRAFSSVVELEKLLKSLPLLLYPSVRCGLEMALFTLLAKSKNLTLAQLLNPQSLEEVPSNALFQTNLPPDKMAKLISSLVAQDCNCLKVKLGRQSLGNDVEMIHTLQDLIPDYVYLRLDVNQRWSFAQLKCFLQQVNLRQIEYIEEPLANYQEIEALAEEFPVGFALDESLLNINPDKFMIPNFVKALVLKPMVLGGVKATLKFAKVARAQGCDVVISSVFESSVGLDSLYQLALALHQKEVCAGLDTRKVFLADKEDFPFLVSSQQSYSFAQARLLVGKIVHNLSLLDIPHSSPVAVLLPTEIRLPLLILGIIASSRQVVILNPNLPVVRLKEQLASLQITHVLLDAEGGFANKFGEYMVVSVALLRQGSSAISLVNDWGFANSNAAASIIFTSGSTGHAKAVVHSPANFHASAQGSNALIPFSTGDRWLVCLPFFHVSGLSLIWRALCGGGSLVFFDKDKSLAEVISRNEITHISLVPSQLYELLLNSLNYPVLKRMKLILVGGNSLPLSLWQKAKELQLPVYTTYGLSEMASSVTVSNVPVSMQPAHHSGKVLAYRELQINASQEVLVRGDVLFLGYTSSDGLQLPVDEHGWFHTGDLAFMDAEQNLHIRGRKDNLFISGGENIYPEEIEKEIQCIKDVEQVVVIPQVDEKFGCIPVAFLKTSANFPQLCRELPRKLLARLPKYMIPVKFFPWPTDYPSDGQKIMRSFFLDKLSAKAGKNN